MSTIYVPDEYGRLVPTQMPTSVGFIGLYAGPEPPDGYLYCDGSAIGRETYSELFDAIGTLYGVGDGAETFNLPDARGVFFRGDGGENNAAMGERQGDAIRNITGDIQIRPSQSKDLLDVGQNGVFATITAGLHEGRSAGVFNVGGVVMVLQGTHVLNPLAIGSSNLTLGYQNLGIDASRVVPTASENRPVNMALKPCIRYV